MTEKRPDVLIVGAGVIGCSIAHALVRRGAAVTVLERDYPGAVTSRASAGMLVPTAEGLPAGPMLNLAVQSLRLYPTLAETLREESGVDVEYSACGVLVPAFGDQAAQALKTRLSPDNPALQWLPRAVALEREPLLNPTLLGALFHPSEGQVNPAKLVEALTQAAARMGAAFHYGVAVDGLVRHGGRVAGVRTGSSEWHAGATVLAAGAWSGALSRWAGVPLDIQPVRGQVVSLRCVPQPLRTVVFGQPGYLVPRRDGTLLVGATQEWTGFENRATAGNTRMLLESAKRLLPALDSATFLDTWSGLRPASPDEQPVLGPVPGLDGLAVATGHFRNGVLLAPVTGELLAAYLLRGTAAPLKPFGVERFLGKKKR
ncbi:MAG: glycine oxidase ThiO [Dehalococcoidia bacterium]|nr:glycine oxidase ThiO [Dehalococcoidia bacterium]